MRSRGFTLVELMVVVVMMSLLAAVVSPGLGALRDTQHAAGADDVRRMLRTAQQYARASGRPHGLWLDCVTDRVGLMQLDSAGAVQPATNGLGTPAVSRSLGEDFTGLDLTVVDPGDGSNTEDWIIWFDFRGHPEIREPDGTSPRAVTTDPQVVFDGQGTILIDRVTGVLR